MGRKLFSLKLGRKILGRKKKVLRKIKNESVRKMTFSKRKSELFREASELVTLCGIDIAMIIFSPTGKAYTFGHPDVIDRLSEHGPDYAPPGNPNLTIQSLNQRFAQVMKEKEEREEIRDDHMMTEVPMKEPTLAEALKLKEALEDLKKQICAGLHNKRIPPTP